MTPAPALEAARTGLTVSRRLGVKSFHLLENARETAIRLGQWDWIVGELAAVLEDETDVLGRTTALAGTIVIRYAARDAHRGPRRRTRSDPDERGRHRQAGGARRARSVGGLRGRTFRRRPRTSLDMSRLFYQGRQEARLFAARCALLAGDAAAAKEDLAAAESEGVFGRSSDDELMTIRAGIAALEGQSREALSLYREVLREWRDLGLVWDEARCAIDMATLLDPSDPEVAAAADGARVILTSLGATPFLERLDDGAGATRRARCGDGTVRPGPDHARRNRSPNRVPDQPRIAAFGEAALPFPRVGCDETKAGRTVRFGPARRVCMCDHPDGDERLD